MKITMRELMEHSPPTTPRPQYHPDPFADDSESELLPLTEAEFYPDLGDKG